MLLTFAQTPYEIEAFGRIVAIADVYDALSCRRAFRDALV